MGKYTSTDFKVYEVFFPIKTLVEKIKLGHIVPTMKRNIPEVLWNDIECSHYLESILIDFPLYPFSFCCEKNDTWEIYDGYQRIRAMRKFFCPVDSKEQLNLIGLEFLDEIEGYIYDRLSTSYKKRLLNKYIRFYMVERNTKEEIKHLLLNRLNKNSRIYSTAAD